MSCTIGWQIQKYTVSDIKALQNQNNPKLHKKSYLKKIDQELSNRYSGTRKIRVDAIVNVQHTLTIDGKNLAFLSEAELRTLLREASTFLTWKFGGKNNVLDSNLHRVGNSSHAHLDTIPLTADGRLTVGEIYNRNTLKTVQRDLLKHMQTKFPDLDFIRVDKEVC